MNKSQMIDILAARLGGKKTATEAVNAVLEAIQEAVAAGDKVAIPGFGAFEAVYKPARTARNPQTGAQVNVPAGWAPKFRPGSEFKAAVAARSAATAA